MKKILIALAAALLVPSSGAIAGGIPTFDSVAETTRQTFHLADSVFTETVDLAQRAQQSINEVNATIESANRTVRQAEDQFKQTLENTTGVFGNVFDDILKKNTEKMKNAISTSSKELASAFNNGAEAAIKSVNKDKIRAWWNASAADDLCGGDGTNPNATKYQKVCAHLTWADSTYAVMMKTYQEEVKEQLKIVDSIRIQMVKGGMTQKQMQDAQATLAAVSAQIALRKEYLESLKDEYERQREIANRHARIILKKAGTDNEVDDTVASELLFNESGREFME